MKYFVLSNIHQQVIFFGNYTLHHVSGINELASAFEKIYEKISKYSFKVIVLYHGGEPFLNRNFSKMVKKLRPLADTIKTVTNGSLLNESIIDQILDSGIDIVEFSLDGQSPEENDKVRVGGNFFKISENIKKLVIARNNRNLSKPEIYISNIQFPKLNINKFYLKNPKLLHNGGRENALIQLNKIPTNYKNTHNF